MKTPTLSIPSQSPRSVGLASAVDRPIKRSGVAVWAAMNRIRLTITSCEWVMEGLGLYICIMVMYTTYILNIYLTHTYTHYIYTYTYYYYYTYIHYNHYYHYYCYTILDYTYILYYYTLYTPILHLPTPVLYPHPINESHQSPPAEHFLHKILTSSLY